MILKDIQTYVTVPPTGIGGAFWVIVKLTTDDGIEGIGECYGIPVSGDIACRMVEDTFARFFAGEDPHHVETLFRRVVQTAKKISHRVLCRQRKRGASHAGIACRHKTSRGGAAGRGDAS